MSWATDYVQSQKDEITRLNQIIDAEGFDKSKSGIGEMAAEILRLRRLIEEKDEALTRVVTFFTDRGQTMPPMTDVDIVNICLAVLGKS